MRGSRRPRRGLLDLPGPPLARCPSIHRTPSAVLGTPLPRRPGLFLIDVEDQAVLVAIDGGGIRQVVPLGTEAA